MHLKTGKAKALNFLVCSCHVTTTADYKYLVKILMKIKLDKNIETKERPYSYSKGKSIV